MATSTVAGGAGIRSVTSHAAGGTQYCAQVTLNAITPNTTVGISNASESLTIYLAGAGSTGLGLYTQPGEEIWYASTLLSSGGGSSTNGEVDTIVLDTSVNPVQVYITNNQMVADGYPWNNSATANPATQTGGIPLTGLSGPYFLELNTQEIGTIGTLNTSPTINPVGTPNPFANVFSADFGAGPGSGGSTLPNSCPSTAQPWSAAIVGGGRPFLLIEN